MVPQTSRIQSLKLFDRSFAIVVTIGGMIGLGILRTPGEVAQLTTNPLFFVVLWFCGGCFILLSTNVIGELIGLTSKSGGTYALIYRAYGAFPSFVIGWVDWLSFVADISLKSYVAIEFIDWIIPISSAWQPGAAIMVSTIFAGMQLLGIQFSVILQKLVTILLTVLMIGLALVLYFLVPELTRPQENESLINDVGSWSLAIAAIIYTYDGWITSSYFNGDLVGGGRTAALAAIKSVFMVTGLYVFLMTALAWNTALEDVVGSELAISSILDLYISPSASRAVLIISLLMILSSLNVSYLSAPRIIQALATDGMAFRKVGYLSKSGNPVNAVLISWGLSVMLIMQSGFHFLLYLSVFFYLFIYSVLIYGVISLRRHDKEARPYSAWGHPWSTLICLLCWISIGIFQVINQMETSLYALLMILVAWPIYQFVIRDKR